MQKHCWKAENLLLLHVFSFSGFPQLSKLIFHFPQVFPSLVFSNFWSVFFPVFCIFFYVAFPDFGAFLGHSQLYDAKDIL